MRSVSSHRYVQTRIDDRIIIELPEDKSTTRTRSITDRRFIGIPLLDYFSIIHRRFLFFLQLFRILTADTFRFSNLLRARNDRYRDTETDVAIFHP